MENWKEFFEEMQETLLECEDGIEKVEIITDFAKELKEYPEEEKTPQNKVKGCASTVYISAKKENDKIRLFGFSESLVVKGYVALLVEGLDNISKQELLEESKEIIENFAKETNIKASLSPSRANAFSSIYDKIIEKTKEL